MAKKQTHQRTERAARNDFVKLCAFIGIFLSAILFVVGGILTAVKLGSVASILNLIAQLALLVAVAIPAYRFVRGTHHRKAWTIVYWVCLGLYIFGVVFGVIGIFVFA